MRSCPLPHGEHRAVDAFGAAARDVAAAIDAATKDLGAHGHDVVFDLRRRGLEPGKDRVEPFEGIEGLVAQAPRYRHVVVAIGEAMHAQGTMQIGCHRRLELRKTPRDVRGRETALWESAVVLRWLVAPRWIE